MRARSHAIRRLVARLAIVFIAATLTVACTTGGEPETASSSSEPEVVAVVEPTSEPTAEPVVEPTAIPTAATAAVKPVATPSAPRPVPLESFFIGNTLGRGMALRRAPTSSDLVKAWPDGTAVEGLGAQQDARGWTWAWVRDPEGNDGWIPTQFLVRSPDEPSAPLPLTPAPAEVSVSMAAPQESGVSSPVMATPTSVVAAAAASPGAAPKPKSEVVGSASRWYTSLGNSLNVVGTVENKGREPVVLKRVALSLLSESGQTVGALNAGYAPTVLQPGEKAPWLAFGNLGPTFKDIKVQTETEPFAGSSGERDYSRAFRLDGVSVVPGSTTGGAPKITGQVVNTGARATRSVKILVAVYGPDGSLMDVGQASGKLGTLAAGQSAPFEASFRSQLPTISGYDVFVEGSL